MNLNQTTKRMAGLHKRTDQEVKKETTTGKDGIGDAGQSEVRRVWEPFVNIERQWRRSK
jgi:hypothetical protein